jgi:hypothetical protein
MTNLEQMKRNAKVSYAEIAGEELVEVINGALVGVQTR